MRGWASRGWLLGGLLAVCACSGEIEGAARSGKPGSSPGSARAGAGAGGSGAAGLGNAGSGALPPVGDPQVGGSQPPRFECSAPATRGRGQLAMRRLTRDELLHSFASVLGEPLMGASAVRSAAARIPAEPPGDVVASFQNGHAFDHVEGLLLTAQAIAAELGNDADARTRVLGACATTADRACARAFLDGPALRLLRRPLDAARRDAWLAAFEAEGGGSAGMQWLLARVLQAPEAVFQLELPRQRCQSASAAVETTYAWDDESVFFAPIAGSMTGPQASLTQAGWYVWMIPAARIPGGVGAVHIELEVQSEDGAALELDINLNDAPLMHGVMLSAGKHDLDAAAASAAGGSAKVGVYFKNAAAGRSLVLRALTLTSAAPAPSCSDEPPANGLYPVDDWSVASRLAFALTGEGPDQPLLDAAARGELATVEQVRPHAERLITTPAARRQLEAVLDAWLNLDAIPTPHPALVARAGVDGSGLAAEARRELLDYASYQILDQEAGVGALMSEAIGFPRSERLATLYGSAQARGDQPVALENGHGGMLLRLAPLLSGQLSSSPILRGVYVRKRILCDVLPSPDFSIVSARLEMFEAEDRTKESTREAVSAITSQGACPTCHVQINPIGFTLERFDPLGQPRDEEIVFDPTGKELARHPIDTHVTGANLEPGLPDELDGAEQLNAALAGSAKVRACVAERFYTHARLRPAAEGDHCALSEVERWLRDGGSIKEAWLRSVVGPELFVREATTETAP